MGFQNFAAVALAWNHQAKDATAARLSFERCQIDQGQGDPCWKPTRYITRSRTCLSGQTFLGGIFDYAERKDRLEEVSRELEDPNVWNDPDYAQKLGKERSSLEAIAATIDELDQGLGDSRDLLELAEMEEDEDTVEEVREELDGLQVALEKARISSHVLRRNG